MSTPHPPAGSGTRTPTTRGKVTSLDSPVFFKEKAAVFDLALGVLINSRLG
jgi:hypothetical protein